MRVEPTTGDLITKTADGDELRQALPKIYQQVQNQNKEIGGKYQILRDETVAFALPNYDHSGSLVIDPTVAFTTFIQGSSEDFPVAIAVNESGYSFVTGFTLSNDFPLLNQVDYPSKNCDLVNEFTPAPPGVFEVPLPAPGGPSCGEQAFLAVLSPTGTLLASSYIFGPGFDNPLAIAADSQGVYIAGITNSPSATNQIDLVPTPGKFANAFVLKFNSAGENLEWVTELGGASGSSGATSIALDSSHAAYITGTTCAFDFRTTGYFPQGYRTTPWQGVLKGACDAFVAKIDYLGHPLYATFLGGSSLDEGQGIAVDGQGYAYVTGMTCSPDFPDFNTTGPHGFPGFGCEEEGNGYTAFVTKVLPDGSGALYSFYLGGTEKGGVVPADIGNAIAVDAIGEAYVTGLTASPNFFVSTITTPLQQTLPCEGAVSPSGKPLPCESAFVTKIFPLGSVGFSTYLGTTAGRTVGDSIAVNSIGQIYVAGRTDSTVGFPAAPASTPNPYEGYLTKLSPSLDSAVFTTLLGAEINSIAILKPTSLRSIIDSFFFTSIYTTGYRYMPGSDVNDPANVDVFVVEVSDAHAPVVF